MPSLLKLNLIPPQSSSSFFRFSFFNWKNPIVRFKRFQCFKNWWEVSFHLFDSVTKSREEVGLNLRTMNIKSEFNLGRQARHFFGTARHCLALLTTRATTTAPHAFRFRKNIPCLTQLWFSTSNNYFKEFSTNWTALGNLSTQIKMPHELVGGGAVAEWSKTPDEERK